MRNRSFRRIQQTFVIFVTVLVLLASTSCKFDEAPLSDEAQAKAYFEQVEAIEKPSKDAEQRLSQESKPLYDKLLANYAEVGPKLADMNEKELPITMEASKKLLLIKPPERLSEAHKLLCELCLEGMTVTQKINTCLRSGNEEQLRKISLEFKKKTDIIQEKYTNSLKAAGFASMKDFESIDTVPKKPLAWYWTIILLAIGSGFAIGFLQLAFVLTLIPAAPLWVATVKLWENHKFLAATMIGVITMTFLAVAGSCIGTALATLAESVMWPKTQLAPWFVYPVAGLTSFTFFAGGSSSSEKSEGAAIFSIAMCFCCLIGFLYVALGRGYLVGPWLWIHNHI